MLRAFIPSWTCCVLKLDADQNVRWQSRPREGWRFEFNGAERLKVALQAYSVVLEFIIVSLIIYFCVWGKKGRRMFNLRCSFSFLLGNLQSVQE